MEDDRPLLDLGSLDPTELDLGALDAALKTRLGSKLDVAPNTLEDSYGEFHLSMCRNAGPTTGQAPLGNLSYRLASCCEDDLPADREQADLLAKLVLALREDGPLAKLYVAGLKRDLDELAASPEYAPLAAQFQDCVDVLEDRRQGWHADHGLDALKEEAARRSTSGVLTSLAPLDLDSFLRDSLMRQGILPGDPEDAPEARSVPEHLLESPGPFLVEVAEEDYVFKGRVKRVLAAPYQAVLGDALEEMLVSESVALLPTELLALALVPHSEHHARVLVTDVSGEDAAVLEAATALLGDGGLSVAEALELARELG